MRPALTWSETFTMHRNLVAVLLVAWLALPAARAQDDPVLADEMALKSAGLSGDGASLLAFFRLRTRGEATPERLKELVARLGAQEPAARRKAAAELVGLGPPTVPVLREAAKDPDVPRVAALARTCLRALDEKNSAQVTSAAVRLLARRRPPGTAEVLLAYLPSAEDPSVLEEVANALVAVAYHDGRPDPAVLAALEDEAPLRRATAIRALCQADGARPPAAVRKLLHDPMPSVRLRAGLALARAWDPEAVATLIGLLPDLAPEPAREAEDYLSRLAGEQAPKVALGEDRESRVKARDAWAAWWRSAEGPGLLEELRKRTLTEADRIKGDALVRKLGDEEFAVREQATKDLQGMGPLVVPLLRQAARNPDLEVRTRAQQVLASIEQNSDTPLSPVTARLIALRKPTGAAAALLAYLPFADDDALVEEVQSALNAVAYHGGKADPVLVKALSDGAPARRAAAAEALCQGPADEHRAAVRQLLRDENPEVRLRAALALAGAREREAVPVLISLLGELPGARADLAEDYLRRLAAGRPPADLPAGESEEARNKRRDAWAAWWQASGAGARLVPRHVSQLTERYHGYTLLVQSQNNQVVELGPDGKERWKLTGLLNPMDAQVLPGDRVLVAEYNGQRVTERNLKGDVLWQKQLKSWPISAERLPSGNTFIACRNLLLEVNHSGREVLSISRPQNDVMSARKLRDGSIVMLSSNNRSCVRLDRTGKQLKSFPVQVIVSHANEVLSNGHVLVPLGWLNKVVEYDPEGKPVWEVTATQPISAHRLPNGNTLVALQQWPGNRVIEVDRSGKQVAEMGTQFYTARAKRR
jgi:HEAT repeat protein